ncbi:ATP-binding cassette domain-containing protein [Mesobacterium pallidum]|uniref:ATP-binding cassette domain-containing protein n=1 Tax=Mesobacterium pallidum TaxID=2872037 RepID=UPI001EE27C0A|nr:ATP-binding cassette domain-containing protein [Mesobacterium pallidum]
MSVLSTRDLRKSYGATEALRGVSFDIGPGQYVGLLGPNGAGKSTLFQLIAGLFAPDGGALTLFGESHGAASSQILRRLGVVFQARSVDLDMSVQANLSFHGRLFGLSGSDLAARIDQLAADFGLSDMLSRPVRTLSGGQQRRVEIARALINRPELLIMDEPSAGLDATSRAALVATMHRLAKDSGTAILWATHLVDEVENADRILLLAEGTLRADGTPSEVLSNTGTTSLLDAYTALSRA